MKNIKKIQMCIALLMAISIVSVGYSSWAIILPPTESTHSGAFDSYPVIKTDEYLKLITTIPFTEFCNYDPDPTNTDEAGELDRSDVTGAFMMMAANAQGYLNVSPSAAIILNLQPGAKYQGNDIFTNDQMLVEITVSFGENSTESALFFDNITKTVAVTGVPGSSTAQNFAVEQTDHGTLLITGLLNIPSSVDLTSGAFEISLFLTANDAFDDDLFAAGATAKDLIFSTVVKTVD